MKKEEIEEKKIKKEKEPKEKKIKKVEEKKEKSEKKDKNNILLIIIIIILLLLLFIAGIFLLGDGSYTITFDTDGGTPITGIEVKNGEVVKMPEDPVKEGYIFTGWVTSDDRIVTNGVKFTDDVTIKATWVEEDAKLNTVTFDTDGGVEIGDFLVKDGVLTRLPIDPEKEGYIFVGWLNDKGQIIRPGIKFENNLVLKAFWIPEIGEKGKVTFNFDNGEKTYEIIFEKDKKITLPITPIKEGYKFKGWVDSKGNVITTESVITGDMALKASWVEPYTCPADCTPIGDGSNCTKTLTTDMITYTGCPTGTESVDKFCTSHQKQVAIGFDEDMTYEIAGIICSGNPNGYCVDYNNRYTIPGESCPTGYFRYTYSESGLDAVYGCAKKSDMGGKGCPEGFTKNGEKCTKTITEACKAN